MDLHAASPGPPVPTIALRVAPGAEARASAWRARLGIVGADVPTETAFIVELLPDRTEVVWRDGPGGKLRIAAALDAPPAGANPLVRAVRGSSKATELAVVDATAGLGADAWLLAHAGMRVTMIERDPLLAGLLCDAVLFALRSDDAEARAAAERVRVLEGEATVLLPAYAASVEAVYLDPMYPRTKGGAKRQRAAFLRAWLGAPTAASEEKDRDLVGIARSVACRRVVVKRPLKAPPVVAGVSGSLRGSTTRFDLYSPAANALR